MVSVDIIVTVTIYVNNFRILLVMLKKKIEICKFLFCKEIKLTNACQMNFIAFNKC